jgi:hypothetical protein
MKQAALGRRPDGVTLGHRSGGVAALAWVTADPALLGVAVAHGTFLVWDTAGEGPTRAPCKRGQQSLAPPCLMQPDTASSWSRPSEMHQRWKSLGHSPHACWRLRRRPSLIEGRSS